MKQKLRKSIAVTMCMILCFSFSHSIFAYYEPMAQSDPTDKIVEIEAEDFEGTDKGFSVAEDSEASGGKVIVGGGNIQNEAVYELPIEGYGENLVVYIYHKAETAAENLSFIAIDGFESNEIYAEELGEWCVSRFYYGEILGTHMLKISNARKGHKIDKLVVKYNQRKFEKSENDWYGEYWQGNDAVKDLQIKEIEERTTGSYFFEAEDGMEGFDGNFGTGKVGYEEGTSNGAYWYNDTSVAAYLDPLADDSYSARYKFYVSQPGTYWLWVRCYKPRDLWKSTWFGIDNKDYVRVDQGTMEQWQWVKHYARNLDVGWHTLDMKYRQSGHRIDCMVLTMISTFTPQGIGSLPGEPPPVSDAMQQNYEKSRNGDKVRGFNIRLHADAPIKNDGRNIYAPGNNIAQVMGIEFEEHDGHYLMKENRNYLKIYPKEKRFIANGTPKSIGAAPYMVESNFMIPIAMVEQAFDIDSYYLEKENALFVFYRQQENYRKALPGELEIIEEEDDGSLFVRLPHDNPDAKAEFWIRRNNTDANILEMNNFDGAFKVISTEYKYDQFGDPAHRQLRQMSWQKMSDPYYKDGAFYAREFELWSGAIYDIKVRITENNKEDVFVAEKAYRSTDKVGQIAGNLDIYKLLELAGKVTNGELLATPTFENIGYYIDTEFEDMAKCEVTFRKVGDSEWEKAYKPFFDEMPNQFRGSIVNLEPDTEYEINAKIYDSKGKLLTDKSTVTKTWSETPNIGTKLKISEVYDGDGTLYLQDIPQTLPMR